MTVESQYLFVYGTLRDGSDNDGQELLQRCARFLGEGTVRAKLYDVGDYPGAVPSSRSSDSVRGEVFELKDQERVLRELDRYEGCGPEDREPTEFRREITSARLISGPLLNAWIHHYNHDVHDLPEIASGDYVLHRSTRRTSAVRE